MNLDQKHLLPTGFKRYSNKITMRYEVGNVLILGLVSQGIAIEDAKQIFRLIRDQGYSLQAAKRKILGVPVTKAVVEAVKEEPVIAVPEPIEEKVEPKTKPKVKPKAKPKGKKKK